MHQSTPTGFWERLPRLMRRARLPQRGLRAAASLFMVLSMLPLSVAAPTGSGLAPTPAAAATFTVTTNLDAGAGSLRQAITDANAAAGADVIEFAGTCAVACTIAVLSALPDITDTVTITGPVDGGGLPLVTLNGSGAPGGSNGFTITSAAGASSISGLSIINFSGAGILLNGGGGHTITGNFIGLGADGTTNGGNNVGIQIDGSINNTVGGTDTTGPVLSRNVISRNAGTGVLIIGTAATGNKVQGNIIGLALDGETIKFNTNGVRISNSSSNVIGGELADSTAVAATKGNTISGNIKNVIIVGETAAPATSNVVRGNRIGTNVAGTTQKGQNGASFASGLEINGINGNATLNVVTENTISGNQLHGVYITGDSADSNTVSLNRIGIAEGTTATVSNLGDGVRVDSNGTGNSIRQNLINGNGGLGINLVGGTETLSVTANDAGDGDTGPNNLQNFPVITEVAVTARTTATTGTAVRVKGSLDSTAGTYTIDVHSVPSCDASGNGEGLTYLGNFTLILPGEAAAFAATGETFTSATAIGEGTIITTTATSATGDTSEFSACNTVASSAIIAPAAPTGVEAAGGNTQATVRWTPPTDTGGSPITSYTIASTPDTASTPVTVTCPAECTVEGDGKISKTVTGLTNDVSYTFTVTATNAAGTSAESAPSNAVTPTNTPQITLTISAPDTNASGTTETVAESVGTVTLTATASPTTAEVITVSLTFTGTATNGTDYTCNVTGVGACAGGNAEITIASGASTGTLVVTIVNDTTDEPSQTAIADITGVACATCGATESGTQQVTVTITDDDLGPNVTLSASAGSIAENAGTPVTVTATLAAAAQQDLTVTLGFSGAVEDTDFTDAANGGSSYVDATNTLTIPAGALSAAIDITPIDNGTDAPDKTLVVEITATTATEATPQSVSIILADNEVTPSGGGGGGGGRTSPPTTSTPTPTPTPSPSPSSSPSPSPAGSVGATGGSILVNGGAGQDGGFTLSFPPGAVSQTTSFTASMTNSAPTGVTAPTGTRLLPISIEITPNPPGPLSEQVTLLINLTPQQLAGVDINNIVVGIVTPTGVQLLHTTVVNAGEGVLQVMIDHFTTFVLLEAIGPRASLSGPQDGAMLPGLGTTLTWTNPAETKWFNVRVVPFNADGPGINLIIGDAAQVAAAQFQVRAPDFGGANGNYVMLPDMTYTWWVRVASTTAAPTEEQWGPWESRQFHTGTTASTSLARVAPQAQEVVTSRTPTLTWSNGDKSVFYYEIQMSKNQNFGSGAFLYHELVHGGASTPANSYVVPSKYPLEANTTYYWRVRPRIQGDGEPLDWGTTWIFKTQ